jgi:hypothetical protein
MIPSVAQQLQAVRRTLAEAVIPAIDPSESFAREQAGLIVATLDRVLDVQSSEYRYDLLEYADANALVRALDELGAPEGRTGAATIDDAPDDLDALRAATLVAKQRAEARFRALLGTEHADVARALLGVAGRRTTERELAAARMTGFPRPVGSIAEVLDRQAAEPFDAVVGARR